MQNLAAVISFTRTNIGRMNRNSRSSHQSGENRLTNNGYDITFAHVGLPITLGNRAEGRFLHGEAGRGYSAGRPVRRQQDDSFPSGFPILGQQCRKITVGGMDISQIDPETLLSLYSIVFQDVTLFDNTILENIRIGNKRRHG